MREQGVLSIQVFQDPNPGQGSYFDAIFCLAEKFELITDAVENFVNVNLQLALCDTDGDGKDGSTNVPADYRAKSRRRSPYLLTVQAMSLMGLSIRYDVCHAPWCLGRGSTMSRYGLWSLLAAGAGTSTSTSQSFGRC